MPFQDTVTADQLGDLLGISSRSVRDLAARGVIEKAGRGRYPVREAVRSYAAHLRDTAALRGGDDTTLSEKRREAKERADKLALANERARGDLVSREAVAATWTGILMDVRAALLAVPSRLPELPKPIAGRVDEEIRQALEGLAKNA